MIYIDWNKLYNYFFLFYIIKNNAINIYKKYLIYKYYIKQ